MYVSSFQQYHLCILAPYHQDIHEVWRYGPTAFTHEHYMELCNQHSGWL